jgi:hypothetical protein
MGPSFLTAQEWMRNDKLLSVAFRAHRPINRVRAEHFYGLCVSRQVDRRLAQAGDFPQTPLPARATIPYLTEPYLTEPYLTEPWYC